MYSRVYVEITNICNMNCSFCHGHSRSPRSMTEVELRTVLMKLKGYTGHICYHLMGEPLTHPELPRFIEEAKDLGFKSVITTNGALLSKRKKELISVGPHKVSISLHSFEEDDDKMQAEYLGGVIDFAKEASECGIIVVLRLWNRGTDDGRNDKTLEFLKNTFPEKWTENNRGYTIRKKLYLEWGDRFEWPDMAATDNGDTVTCRGMRDHFGILSDGTVVPCCLDSDGVVNLGNIFESSVDEIINSPRAAAIKKGFEQRHASEELCRRCGYAKRFLK